MVSMMSIETQNNAGGSSDAITRAISPRTTTLRPDSHTKRNTAGTFRRAVTRSRHPLWNSGFVLMIWPTSLNRIQSRSTLESKRPWATEKDRPGTLRDLNVSRSGGTPSGTSSANPGQLERFFDEETAPGVGGYEN